MDLVPQDTDFGPTAAIVTVGDEIVEGRILNENATWLSEQLMTKGLWPRLVVAVPDEGPLIVRILRIAADAADLLFVCGGLGFTPDDITRQAVALAFYRQVYVDRDVAASFRENNAWADERVAAIAATLPADAQALESPAGGVPGFRLGNTYVLPGAPSEMRAMFAALEFSIPLTSIHRVTITADTTEDQIGAILEEFTTEHSRVRLGSYPNLDHDPPQVTLVLVSRSAPALDLAAEWLRARLTTHSPVIGER
jgi:molybdenum cofactor synthesis domain-containing protein